MKYTTINKAEIIWCMNKVFEKYYEGKLEDIFLGLEMKRESIFMLCSSYYEGKTIKYLVPYTKSDFIALLREVLKQTGDYAKPFIPILQNGYITCRVKGKIENFERKRKK